jgi:hypothetical protein
MLTSTDRLFLTIFHEAYSFEGDPKFKASEYLTTYGQEISALGRALVRLDLAAEDKQCALGWKPTLYLLSIVAKHEIMRPLKQSGKVRTEEDIAIMDVIVDAAKRGATGTYDEDELCSFVSDVLTALGLLRDDAALEEKPTRALRELFWEAYRRRIPRAS